MGASQGVWLGRKGRRGIVMRMIDQSERQCASGARAVVFGRQAGSVAACESTTVCF